MKKLVVLVLSIVVASALAADPTGPVPGKFIVKLKVGAKGDNIRMALGREASFEKLSRLKVDQSLRGGSAWDRFYVYHTSDEDMTAQDVIHAVGAGNVEYVEQDYYVEFFDFPSDQYFEHQWYLYNHGQQYYGIDRIDGDFNDELVLKTGTPGKDIRLTDYYGNPPAEHTRVVVAIVDSGVDLFHPELQGQIWHNPDEIPYNNIDDDHNGMVDDTIGYDVSGDVLNIFNPQGDNDPSDPVGHGSHIAGIVAARSDGIGVVGVAPNALIMAVKIRPNATNAVAAAGIMYAVNAGCDVINISWGTPFESGILHEAIRFARANNVFVAIAPGNFANTDRYYPAGFDSTFVVAAGNSDGFMTYFTSYGAHVDVVAPGLDILSIRGAGTDLYADSDEPGVRIVDDDSLYFLADGTSMATPIVAGAAALMWSVHPDLTVPDIESALRASAIDLVDPFGTGEDTLIGPDTISGYGYLNVDGALALFGPEGLSIAGIEKNNRYTEDIEIKVKATGGYSGGWTLDYCLNNDDNWVQLAQGVAVPADSVLYHLVDTTLSGHIYLRLRDLYGNEHVTSFVYVRHNKTEIGTPVSGEELKYNIPIVGSAYGPNFDSLSIFYQKNGVQGHLFSSTGEFFDSLVYQWTVSGVDTGMFTIFLFGYYGSETILDTSSVFLKSAFAEGWPVTVAGRTGLTPVVADLDHDGAKEIVVASGRGVYAFRADGSILPNFPVLPEIDMRCIPAIYDVDRDGVDDIICTNADGVHVFTMNGEYAPGWPRQVYTGQIPYNYAYPIPTVAKLAQDEDSAIVLINRRGEILAYEFNGDSYFYSLQGLFTSFDPRISDSYLHGGFTSPFVTSLDIDRDGYHEVLASYTAPYPYEGIGLFDGRNGLPAFGWESPLILQVPSINGTTLGDLDGDSLVEIVTLNNSPESVPTLWVRTNLVDDLAGFPISMPESRTWIGSYPILADLDLDNVPEILFTFFEFDVSRLYIFRADGSAYAQLPGAPAGVAFVDQVTFGTPTVADVLGDESPEIIFRSGYVLPGTGPERVYILDNQAQPVPGWPVTTPARSFEVFSSRFAPLVEDIDGDGKVNMLLLSDNRDLLVWDMEAPARDDANTARFLYNNLNTNAFGMVPLSTGAGDSERQLPASAVLHQNYPNPFNPSTSIEFDVPRRAQVKVEVFNILGQAVRTLVDRELAAGTHRIEFDGDGLASGVYLYRLDAGGEVRSRKMVLVK